MAIIFIECAFIICDEDQLKSDALQDGESFQCFDNVPSVIVEHHPRLILLLPPLDKTSPILDHILSFVTINIYPLLLLPIPPVQHIQPLLGSFQQDGQLCTLTFQPFDHLLHLLCHNKINDVLCLYVPLFGFLEEV